MRAMLLYGMPNSGKSTIAYELIQQRLRNTFIIDGDKHREMQFLGKQLGFSKEDIMHNTEHVVKLAKFAQEQGFNVLIAQITPYIEQRTLMRAVLSNFASVYCRCLLSVRSERSNFVDSELPFETGEPDFIIDTSRSLLHCTERCLEVWNAAG